MTRSALKHIIFFPLVGMLISCAGDTNEILRAQQQQLELLNKNMVEQVDKMEKPISSMSEQFAALVDSFKTTSVQAMENLTSVTAQMSAFMNAMSPESVARALDDFHEFAAHFGEATKSLNSLQSATEFLPVGMAMMGKLMESAGFITPAESDVYAEYLISAVDNMGKLSNMSQEQITKKKSELQKMMAHDPKKKPIITSFLTELEELNTSLKSLDQLATTFSAMHKNGDIAAITGLAKSMTAPTWGKGSPSVVKNMSSSLSYLNKNIALHGKLVACFLYMTDDYGVGTMARGRKLPEDCKKLMNDFRSLNVN